MSRETKQALAELEPEMRKLFIAQVEEVVSKEVSKANTQKFTAEHSIAYVKGLAKSAKKKDRADLDDLDALDRGEAIEVNTVAISNALKAKSAHSAMVVKKNNEI